MTPADAAPSSGVVIVGAGAAGLACAIFLKRAAPSLPVTLLEGARQPGAKILVSGGSRCNVTNRIVTERDFCGGNPAVVRRILKGFTADETVGFFHGIGVPLHEEPGGKLFPDSGRARDVLNALLGAARDLGVDLRSSCRVSAVERAPGGFRLTTTAGPVTAARLVLATGGRSLPKSGSDGTGYDFAAGLGHSIVPTTPALVPLLLGGRLHHDLSGVSHEGELAVWIDGRVSIRLRGSLLWTHFGVSGPLVLNASRHWLRGELEGRPVRLTLSFFPGATLETEDLHWKARQAERPRTLIQSALAQRLPASVAAAVIRHIGIDPEEQLAQLTRDTRGALVSALVELPLRVCGSRGYSFAEATAGGVALDEVDPATLESRRCPSLYLIGEILDVDGRIGGFNFQWAWSSAFVAARALARASVTDSSTRSKKV